MTHPSAPSPAAAGAVTPAPLRARTAAAWSVGAHLALIASVVVFTRLAVPAPPPPAYSVELVAAPAGPRALGAVEEGPSSPTPAPASKPAPEVASPTARTGATTLAPRKPVTPKPTAPAKPATPATPRSGGAIAVPGKTPAGGGTTGGRGRDVANVRVQGIAFPYPGYLENITRQIALNFKPRSGGALRAEVAFLIHRDGSVSDLRLTSKSGAYAFDLECMGAVEAVGQRRSFGALPAGFSNDVLPVVFSFDPSVLR